MTVRWLRNKHSNLIKRMQQYVTAESCQINAGSFTWLLHVPRHVSQVLRDVWNTNWVGKTQPQITKLCKTMNGNAGDKDNKDRLLKGISSNDTKVSLLLLIMRNASQRSFPANTGRVSATW
jgi:hypothetical protein